MNNVEKRWCGALQSRACGALNHLGSERSHLLTDKCVLAPALCGRSVNFFCPVLPASLCDGTGIPDYPDCWLLANGFVALPLRARHRGTPAARGPVRSADRSVYCEGKWSGRPGSNRRHPAWEAGVLPLNYSRSVVNETSLPPEIGAHNSKNFSTTKGTKLREGKIKQPSFVSFVVSDFGVRFVKPAVDSCFNNRILSGLKGQPCARPTHRVVTFYRVP